MPGFNFKVRPRAVIFPDPYPDEAFVFQSPRAVIRGNASQWEKIDEFLANSARETGGDDGIPPGALVGGFSYDGDFYFEDYGRPLVVPRDGFLPEDLKSGTGEMDTLPWRAHMSRLEFVDRVKRAQEFISAGDIYQVNLARKWSLDVDHLDPLELFCSLYQVTEAPLAALVPFGESTVCSVSPELFLQIDGNRIRTRPIKGTRPRHSDTEKDQQNALELRTSPKEIAELVMITDLERNDLGRVCRFGSVRVPDLLKHESFSHVHHLISTVEGELRTGISPAKAVAECFPGGSITGAPKKRAMEIIRDLEPVPRGIYTGALGYFGYDDTAQFNIAIRTCQVEGNRISFFAGSGITAGSNPDEEFDETNHKAAAIKHGVHNYLSKRLFIV